MDVPTILRRHGMPFEVHQHAPVFDAQHLAQECRAPGQNVVKPVLVCLGATYVLCVVPAHRRVDLDKVARAMNAESARLASENELGHIFRDAELGAEPPFGKPYGLPTLMDRTLRDNEYVVFQAGTHTLSIRMLRADYERVAEPVVADIIRVP